MTMATMALENVHSAASRTTERGPPRCRGRVTSPGTFIGRCEATSDALGMCPCVPAPVYLASVARNVMSVPAKA